MLAVSSEFPLSRRQFVQGAGVAGLGLLAGCGRLPWQAQPSAAPRRIGVLTNGPRESQTPPPPGVAPLWDAFRQALHDHGWTEEQNLSLAWRTTPGGPDRLRELAEELVQLPVDLIVTNATPATQAAQQASNIIPIVFGGVADPVGLGFVASLARPGGTLTGLSDLGRQLSEKRLDVLREVVPGLSRVAVARDVSNPGNTLQWEQTQAAAQTLGVALRPLELRTLDDIDPAFAAATTEDHDALLVLGGPQTIVHANRIVEWAAKSGLPAMYTVRQFVDAGGLMAYGVNAPKEWRRAAAYVDKILKGTKPADLPVEQPATFELWINLKRAQATGLTIPQHVLLQATEVIQ